MQSKRVDFVSLPPPVGLVKNNSRFPRISSEARELWDMNLAALERHPLF